MRLAVIGCTGSNVKQVWQLRVTLAAAAALPIASDSGRHAAQNCGMRGVLALGSVVLIRGSSARCSPYCLCNVAGDAPFQCQTAVATDSREPARAPTILGRCYDSKRQVVATHACPLCPRFGCEVWNKTVALEFSGKEPLTFSVYSKDLLLHAIVVLAPSS